MKRNQIAIVALEERQWEWSVYQVGGNAAEKTAGGVLPMPDNSDGDTQENPFVLRRDALLSQWREKRIPYRGMRLVMGIASTDALIRILDLPTQDAEELREMSALQIEKTSPFTMDQTAVGHEVLASPEGSSRILAAGLDLKQIERYGEAFREAGLKPERIDLNLCARWKLISDEPSDDKSDAGRAVHLLVRADACDAIVTDAGIPILCRELVRRDTLSEQDYAAEIVAETTYSLATCDIEHGPSDHNVIVVRHSGEKPLPDLLAMLQQTGASKISAHTTDHLPDLCEGLARRAIRGRRKTLNLAPPAWRLTEMDRARRQRLLLTLGIAAAVWVLVIGSIYGSLYVERHRLNDLERQHAAMEPAYRATTNTRQRVRNLLQYTDQTRSALETLRDISSRQPDGINLASFDYRKGSLIRIAGEAENAALIYDFRNQLDDSPLYTGLDLSSIARAARGDLETFRMNISLPSAAGGGDDQ